MTKEISIVNLHKAESNARLKCHALKMTRKDLDKVYEKFPSQLTEDIQEYLRLSYESDDDIDFSDIAS